MFLVLHQQDLRLCQDCDVHRGWVQLLKVTKLLHVMQKQIQRILER